MDPRRREGDAAAGLLQAGAGASHAAAPSPGLDQALVAPIEAIMNEHPFDADPWIMMLRQSLEDFNLALDDNRLNAQELDGFFREFIREQQRNRLIGFVVDQANVRAGESMFTCENGSAVQQLMQRQLRRFVRRISPPSRTPSDKEDPAWKPVKQIENQGSRRTRATTKRQGIMLQATDMTGEMIETRHTREDDNSEQLIEVEEVASGPSSVLSSGTDASGVTIPSHMSGDDHEELSLQSQLSRVSEREPAGTGVETGDTCSRVGSPHARDVLH